VRILEVVHGFPPLAESGCEVYAHAHARALVEQFADEVLVLTREQDTQRQEYAVRWEQHDGFRCVRINNTFRSTRSFEDSYRNDAIGALAARIIDDFRPEVAHVHHLTCLSTAIVTSLAERNIPAFMTLHDYWLMCHRGQLFDLDQQVCSGPDLRGCQRCLGVEASAPPAAFSAKRAMQRLDSFGVGQGLKPAIALLKRCATAVGGAVLGNSQRQALETKRRTDHMRGVVKHITQFLAPSRFIRDKFIQFGVPPDRIVYSPNGLDHRLFQIGRHRGPRSSATTKVRLGFIGSLTVSKAPHLLIEAAHEMDGVASVDLFGPLTPYHGDDSYLRYLKPLLSADGVRHHGPVPHRDIPNALASIDVLVVPSVWPENSPLVIQEAFLAGVPVVASRIGGIPDLVDHERNGLLFEAGNVEDLRRTIARILGEPGLLQRLRAGIGSVRTIDDDVAATREMYVRAALARDAKKVAQGAGPADDAPRRRIAAVVVNYRTLDDTRLAVRSLLASRRPLDQIVVIDNDAVPSEEVRRHFKAGGRQVDADGRLGCIATTRNLGFSGGVNVGIRAALDKGADAVLLVNSDAIVPPDCLERLEAAMDDGGGIVAPVIAYRSAPGVVATRGMSFDHLSGRMRHVGVGSIVERVHGHGQPWTRVDGVSGCTMLIRRDVVDAIGLFDEDYFFSFEDLDFCLRASRAGFETIVVGEATAYHEGSRSIGAHSPERLYFAARNHLLLARRVTPARSRLRHAYRVLSIVALNIAHAVTSRGAPISRRLGAVVRGTRDYAVSRFGAGSLATTRGVDSLVQARLRAPSGGEACCATDDPAACPRDESSTRA